jgi:hypothetical protein
MRVIAWIGSLGFALVVLASCYSPSLPNGKQQCGNNGACPSGYQCGPDNHCYKSGQIPAGDMSATPPDMAMACTAMSCKGGPKPVCDTGSGACVECLMDVDCPSGKLCNNKACVPGCTATHGCPDGGGMCNTGNKMCVVCMKDADCGGGTPRCDTNSGNCVECLPTNDNCPMGKFCGQVNSVYTCQTGCQTAADCPKPDAGGAIDCCNHICADLDSDGKNCGKCGTDCGNESCCAGKCSDVTTDLTNCGLCGNACMGKNAMWSCKTSMCNVTMCSQGFGDCNGSASDGCEATLATDPNNCGGCNMKCTVMNGVGSCANNACGIGMCNAGFGNCDNNLMNGCETNTSGDPLNCGMCGTKCTYANGVGACVASMCALAMCNNGFSNCDNNLANGCEAATASDPNNCGGCNMKCQGANATETCSASKCVISSCTNGFKDCDMMAGDGCEVATATDPNNCGACGMKCQPGANVATVGCAASACTIVSCNAGFANCDGSVANGCEINTNSDANNCSKCGMKCPNNQTCKNGACMGGLCGNGVIDPGEERDPPPGPFMSAPVDAVTCKWHFENAPQFYCNGGCDWTGAGQGCTQANANIFCKLKTGNPNSTATAFTTTTALAQPGFSCPANNGTNVDIGPLPLRGVNQDVYYQDSSILANHGAGTVINSVTCN